MCLCSLNIIGDLFNGFLRQDYRALAGVPIGGAILLSPIS